MTPHDTAKLKITYQWIHKARTDLALAEHLLSETDSFWGPIAFHSQQAAEKYLKALCVWNDIDFPKTHDVGKLLKLLAPVSPELAEALHEAAFLTPYGAELRYPGDRPEATVEEAKEAVELARQVHDAVDPHLPTEMGRVKAGDG